MALPWSNSCLCFLVPVDMHPGEESLACRLCASATLIDDTKLFSKVVVPTYSHPQQMGIFPFSLSLPTLSVFISLASVVVLQQCHIVELICFFLTDEIEHLLILWYECSGLLTTLHLGCLGFFSYWFVGILKYILNICSLLAVHVAQSSFSCLPIHPWGWKDVLNFKKPSPS